MEDCLFEIKKGQVQQSTQHLQPQKQSMDIDEQEIIIEEQQDGIMPEFQLKVDEVQRILEKMRFNNERVEELKKSYSTSTFTSNEKDISQQLDRTIKENQLFQQRLKRMMEDIANDVQSAIDKDPDEPETRMRIDIQNALTIKVQAVLQETQSAQMEFKADLKKKITRQTGLLDPTLAQEEVEEICEDPSKMQELVSKQIFGAPSIQLKNAVQDIQEKYQDILKLEKSVQQVYQLFSDMAILVKNQGEIIDNIEQNMVKAKDYVAKGEKQLIKAKKDHQAARKKMCCIIALGLGLILIIVAPVLSTSL